MKRFSVFLFTAVAFATLSSGGKAQAQTNSVTFAPSSDPNSAGGGAIMATGNVTAPAGTGSPTVTFLLTPVGGGASLSGSFAVTYQGPASGGESSYRVTTII